MKKLLIALPFVVLCSCGNNEGKKDQKDSMSDKFVYAVSGIQKYHPDITLTPWEGDLYDAVYWRDSLGENVFIISGTPQYFWAETKPGMSRFLKAEEDPETFSEATELFGYHFVLKKGEAKWTKQSEMADQLLGCCDVWMLYQENTLTVADADSNGVGEVCFMYHETEGDGIIGHTYNGTMVLHMDTSYYLSVGTTGAGNDEEKADSGEDKVQLDAPSNYRDYLLVKWDEYYAAQLALDRKTSAAESEENHEGHNH